MSEITKGRPRDGKEVKKVESIRVEPWIKNKLIDKFGSLQLAFDSFVDKCFKRGSK